MDILKIIDRVKQGKKPIDSIYGNPDKIFAIFLMDANNIVYIGKTTNPHKYVEERAGKIPCTHYFVEEVGVDEINEYLAEIFLLLKPIHNRFMPKNKKYISVYQAKKLYRIDKRDFRKIWKAHGRQFEKEGVLYIEQQIIEDVLGRGAYSEDMPKIDTHIMRTKDYCSLSNIGGWSPKILYDSDGNEIEALTIPDEDEIQEQKNMICQNIIKKSYIVTQISSEGYFLAYNEYSKKTEKFFVDEKDQVWQEVFEFEYQSCLEYLAKQTSYLNP